MRLGIVIPYRNRKAHLDKMLPHTISYFRRNTNYEPLFVIVEQLDDLPFNRGALLNIGYMLCRNIVDYVCLHDVDYLPMWADYSKPALPTRVVWWGLHERPIGHGTNIMAKAPDMWLSAVVVMTKEQMEAANGYSNQYWGWGYEDMDITKRLDVAGWPFGRRDGTFIAIDHDSNAFTGELKPTEAADRNRIVFEAATFPDRVNGLTALQGYPASVSVSQSQGLIESESARLMWAQCDLRKLAEAHGISSQK